jgi:hypothetical protein
MRQGSSDLGADQDEGEDKREIVHVLPPSLWLAFPDELAM